MPIHTEQHDARRLLIATATDRVTLPELLSMLAAQSSDAAPGYSLLFDTREATVSLDVTDVKRLADEVVRRKHQQQERGPIAIVVKAAHVIELSRTYKMLCEISGRDTAVQTFRSRSDAETWLAGRA